MANFEISKYEVILSDRGDYGWIMVYDKGGKYRARLDFNTSAPTAPTVTGTFIQVRMHSNMLQRAIDLLRNEKPTFFTWWSTWAAISTGVEPAGEGELGSP